MQNRPMKSATALTSQPWWRRLNVRLPLWALGLPEGEAWDRQPKFLKSSRRKPKLPSLALRMLSSGHNSPSQLLSYPSCDRTLRCSPARPLTFPELGLCLPTSAPVLLPFLLPGMPSSSPSPFLLSLSNKTLPNQPLPILHLTLTYHLSPTSLYFSFPHFEQSSAWHSITITSIGWWRIKCIFK